MNIAFFIDVAIIVFLIYNTITGFKNGLMKSLFFSFGFVIRILATYVVYNYFYDKITNLDIIKKSVQTLYNMIVFALPNLKQVSDILDRIILVFIIYIIVSVITVLIFSITDSLADSKRMKKADKFFGAIYGLLKAAFYLMLSVYFFDKISDIVLDESVKAAFTGSSLIVPFYTYNIFMHIFGI